MTPAAATAAGSASATQTETAAIWPDFTVQGEQDVVIAALSLLRLAELCGTPCVHTADAQHRYPEGRPGDERSLDAGAASVVVARVVHVEWRSDLRLHATIDADVTGCRPAGGEVRVIGRVMATLQCTATLESSDASATGHKHGSEAGPEHGLGILTRLPADTRAGDLVVIPCLGITALHDVKPHTVELHDSQILTKP